MIIIYIIIENGIFDVNRKHFTYFDWLKIEVQVAAFEWYSIKIIS